MHEHYFLVFSAKRKALLAKPISQQVALLANSLVLAISRSMLTYQQCRYPLIQSFAGDLNQTCPQMLRREW
jgi:hypothetical protein